MKYRLMDLLACPICKSFPLKLTVFEEYHIAPPDMIIKCELYCAYHGDFVDKLGETRCGECYSKEVKSGILECPSCGRWYPVDGDIPRMLPDELRQQQEDLDFLRRWKDRISEQILLNGKPFNLSQETEVRRSRD